MTDSMRLASLLICLSLLAVGCGPPDTTRLVPPVDTYQPTPQELENQARFQRMRQQRDDGG
ncbi:hypothetical protein FYK55_19360 [Roseiconus nitratireducens]|uniref:Lipoprotein n=1 Tax=Roseiconus nitratireducens TaxID=2605748 RepID=A0A5M6D225_9BACT|nr:hypothetical protein [Roseiconus nitratireducens]KAA5541056.1 hypothetical protein FYK55_19360 [Roseiconus nitratireducens]